MSVPDYLLSVWQSDRVARLVAKELREIFRDRRTITTLVAMPLLLYPLMAVAFQQFYLASRLTADARLGYDVGVYTVAEREAVERRLEEGRQAWRLIRGLPSDGSKDTPEFKKKTMIRVQLASRNPDDAHPGVRFKGQFVRLDLPDTKEQDELREQLEDKLREGLVHLVIEIPKLREVKVLPEAGAKEQDLPCELSYIASYSESRAALSVVEMLFSAANEEDLKKRLNLPGVPPSITVLSLRLNALTVGESDKLVSLAALVPLILILMTITGAVYPAIDLTAGERERGTLEILIAAPVPRFKLLAAKYVTVVTVAVLNAIVNLVCMAVTIYWSGMGAVLIRDGGLSFTLLAQVFVLLLLFAAFFSAVLLCLTSFARSFKEAQAYLIPLMLASLTPGILAMIPGLKLEGMLTVLPLVNIVLLARDLFNSGVDSSIDPLVVTIVVGTTILYAVAALALAARVFGAESVLYSEQSGWSDLLRRPETPQPTATIPAILWCLALMLPIQFGLLALVRALAPSPATGILLSVAVNAILFGVLPAIFIFLERVKLSTGLGLAVPRPLALLAGLLLGVSLWPVELRLLALAHSDLPQALQDIFGATLQNAREASLSIGIVGLVLALGVLPAILEEFFFRGLLFNALKARSSTWITIGVTGLLFGLTHVVLGGALGLDRLVPSLLLGLILGIVCWRTGSIWPGVIQHVCHNSILLSLGMQAPGSTQVIPWYWLAAGAIGAVIAAIILWKSDPRLAATP